MNYPLPSDDPLGTDVELDQNGDLVMLTSGDISHVQDADNVSQSVRTGLTTIPSTYFWDDWDDINLAEYVDAPITDYDTEVIQGLINKKLISDDRILEIQAIDIDQISITDGLLITVQALVDGVGVVQIPVVVGGVSD